MYQDFAQVYDACIDEAFYQKWFDSLTHFLGEKTRVLDLGCGSGSLLATLAAADHVVTGVDISAEMLVCAQEKLQELSKTATLFQMDMCEYFAGRASYDIIVSTCDSINYIESEQKLLQLFQHVYDMLDETGVFLFDVHSDDTFTRRFSDWSYADATVELSVLWNTFTADMYMFEHHLTFFQREGELYRRFDEVHRQYFHHLDTLLELLRGVGFVSISFTSDFTDVYQETGARTFVRAVKRGTM